MALADMVRIIRAKLKEEDQPGKINLIKQIATKSKEVLNDNGFNWITEAEKPEKIVTPGSISDLADRQARLEKEGYFEDHQVKEAPKSDFGDLMEIAKQKASQRLRSLGWTPSENTEQKETPAQKFVVENLNKMIQDTGSQYKYAKPKTYEELKQEVPEAVNWWEKKYQNTQEDPKEKTQFMLDQFKNDSTLAEQKKNSSEEEQLSFLETMKKQYPEKYAEAENSYSSTKQYDTTKQTSLRAMTEKEKLQLQRQQIQEQKEVLAQEEAEMKAFVEKEAKRRYGGFIGPNLSYEQMNEINPEATKELEDKFYKDKRISNFLSGVISAFDQSLKDVFEEETIKEMEKNYATSPQRFAEKFIDSASLNIFSTTLNAVSPIQEKDGKLMYNGFIIGDEFISEDGKNTAGITDTIASFLGAMIPYGQISGTIKQGVQALSKTKSVSPAIRRIAGKAIELTEKYPVIAEMSAWNFAEETADAVIRTGTGQDYTWGNFLMGLGMGAIMGGAFELGGKILSAKTLKKFAEKTEKVLSETKDFESIKNIEVDGYRLGSVFSEARLAYQNGGVKPSMFGESRMVGLTAGRKGVAGVDYSADPQKSRNIFKTTTPIEDTTGLDLFIKNFNEVNAEKQKFGLVGKIEQEMATKNNIATDIVIDKYRINAIEKKHGKYAKENLILSLNKPDHIISFVDPKTDKPKLNFIKYFNDDDYFIASAERRNGHYVITFFEPSDKSYAKSVLNRGVDIKNAIGGAAHPTLATSSKEAASQPSRAMLSGVDSTTNNIPVEPSNVKTEAQERSDRVYAEQKAYEEEIDNKAFGTNETKYAEALKEIEEKQKIKLSEKQKSVIGEIIEELKTKKMSQSKQPKKTIQRQSKDQEVQASQSGEPRSQRLLDNSRQNLLEIKDQNPPSSSSINDVAEQSSDEIIAYIGSKKIILDSSLPQEVLQSQTAQVYKPVKQKRKINDIMAKALFSDDEQFKDLTVLQKGELSTLSPTRASEQMDGKRFGLWKDNFLLPIQSADKNFQIELKKMQTEKEDLFKGMSLKEREAVFNLAENKGTSFDDDLAIKNPKIKETTKKLRETYDSLFDRINEARKNIGKDPIKKRQDYITHYREMSAINDILTMVGMNMTEVPNSMLAISMYTKPNSPYFKFAKRRLGELTDRDAKKAFESYLEPALKTIHFSEPIKKARDILEYRVAKPSDFEGGMVDRTSFFANKYPNAYKYWTDYLNALSGKRDIFDKLLPTTAEGAGFLGKLFASGSIGGNLSTVFLQPASIRNTVAETGLFAIKGQLAINTPKGYKFYSKNSRIGLGRSYEPTNKDSRYIPKKINKVLDKVGEAISIPVSILDKEMVGGAFLSGYYKGKALGLSEKDAIRYGDDVAERTQASANIVDRSPINRGKIKTTLGQFQTFVYNEWSQIKNDIAFKLIAGEKTKQMPGEGLSALVEGRKTGAKRLAGFAITSYVMGEVFEALGLDNPYTSEDSSVLGDIPVASSLYKYLVNSVPFVSSVRFGGSPVLQAGINGTLFLSGNDEQRASAIKKLTNLGFRLFPGGGQIQKTSKAVIALENGGEVRSASGKTVNFVIDKDDLWNVSRALMFGVWQTNEGQAYLDERFGSKKEEESNKTIKKKTVRPPSTTTTKKKTIRPRQ